MSHNSDAFFNLTFWVTTCDEHVKNMFKRDDLDSRFRILLTGWRLFTTIKILVLLLVVDLRSNSKN